MTGSITLSPGLHTVDLRFGQGTGLVGPNSGAYDSYGVAYNTAGNTSTGGTWYQMGAQRSQHPVLRRRQGAPNSSMVVSNSTTLDLSGAGLGLAALGSLADASASPTGQRLLLGGGTLDVGLDNSSTTFSGAISGAGGSLMKLGTGTLTLAGTNTYTGATTVSAGILSAATTAALPGYNISGRVNAMGGAVLAVQVGGTAGWNGSQIDSLRAIAIWSTNAAALGIDTSNGNFTYGSNITQAMGLTKLGANTLTLTGSNTTYSGATTVSGGTLQLGDGSSGHNAALSTSGIIDNSALTYNPFGSLTANYVVRGNGSLTKAGSGALTLTAGNTYSGATTIGGGTLQIGNGGSGELLASSSINDNGTLAFNHADTLVYSGPISGTGNLVKEGGGTLTLTGGNTFSGGTTILGGTLKLGGVLSGFGGNGLGWTVNSSGISSTPITNNVLTLTDNNGNEARSAFYNVPVGAGPFTASFIYQAGGNMAADGTAFVLQNDSRGPGALGAAGGGLGYSGISPSAAIEFNLYGGYVQGTGFNTNGATGVYTSTGLGITQGHPIRTVLTYNGSSSLTEQLTDLDTQATFNTSYGVNLAQTIGGNSLYVGFTGGDGVYFSTQTISNFVFSSSSVTASNVLPANSPVRIGSGVTLDMSGASQTIASLGDAVPGARVGARSC